jgi:hypothetical protein
VIIPIERCIVSEEHLASIFRVEEISSAKKPASKQVADDMFFRNVG